MRTTLALLVVLPAIAAAVLVGCRTPPLDHPIVDDFGVITPARDLAGITESLGIGVWRPNELRHTAASLLSDAGVPLEHVADLLGHTNTRMLEQTYRHSVQPSTRAAVAPMDKILGVTRDVS